MKWMQSPTPNRNGEYDIHDVPDRKVEGLREQGWKEVEPKPKKEPTGPSPSGKTKSYTKSKKTG